MTKRRPMEHQQMNNRGPKEKQQETHKRITIGKSNKRITVEKPNRRPTESQRMNNRGPKEKQQETHKRITVGKSNKRITVEKPNRDQ